ncbi:nucleoporin protein Ndc1-Nup [Absidia repens]|uniref:Nucleoporin protein Ndc1-Nup n=1 Tax=Absidia repens TaxID=90262 RepID=A0A1X2IPS8_9FUNG|nr:nucleoporin protein Ndc1-Nup [Absidia repens]
MNSFIKKTTQPTITGTLKPPCYSYTKAYDVLFLQQTKNCALILLVVAALTTTCLESIQFTLPSWRTLIYTIILWASLILLLLYRLISNTFQRNMGPTLKSDLLTAITGRENSIRIMVYTFISIVLVLSSFILLFRTTIPNNIINRQRHGAQQINLERLYVFFYACLLGLSFSIYRNFHQLWVIQMQVVQQNPLYLIKYSTRSSVKPPLSWSFGIFAASYMTYLLFSGTIYKLATHFIGIFTPVLDAPIIGFRWWDVVLFGKMIIVGYSIVWNWVFVDIVVDAYFNKVDDCISPYSNPIGCLIDGLQQRKEEQLRGRAFAELARLSSVDPVKRKVIYNDMGNNNAPSTWSRIRTECIVALDELTDRINAEYKVDKTQDKTKDIRNSESDKTAATESKPGNKKTIKLVDGNIIAQRRKNVAQFDDRTFHAVSNAATQVSDRLPSPDIHVGKLISSGWAKFLKSKIGKSIASTRPKGKIGQWLHYLCDETKSRKMYTVLGNPAMQIYSIKALSNLLTFSLQEDDLGHVQYDISTIVNVLLGCLSTVNTYVQSPPPHYLKLSELPDVPLLAPFQLDLALTDALLTIKLSFSEHLDGIAVDDKYLSSWNQIV